jgi:cellulose synthase (UDP-forming)
VDAALHWIFAYTYRIAALVVPLFYWYFNILVLDATVPEVIEYFGVFFLFSILSLSFISNGLVFPILHDVGQVLGTFPIARAAYTGLFLPHGHAFKVTAKGGDRSRTVVQWGLMRPFLVLFVLTAVGLVLGLVSWRFEFSDAGDGKVVTLFWTLYNLFVLGLTILACIELPRMDRRFADVPERVVLEVDGGEAIPVWMRGLTLSGARLRGIELPVGQGVAMTLRGRLRLAARVIRCEPGNVIVRLELGEEERITLLRWLHTEGGAPNVTRPSRFGVLGDLLIRLATGRA